MRGFLDKMRERPEYHKQGVALGLSLAITLLVALGWAGQKGLLLRGDNVAEAPRAEISRQPASALTGQQDISPIESSKMSITSGLEEVKEQYQKLKEALANVLVPFMTGIEVYEKGE